MDLSSLCLEGESNSSPGQAAQRLPMDSKREVSDEILVQNRESWVRRKRAEQDECQKNFSPDPFFRRSGEELTV